MARAASMIDAGSPNFEVFEPWLVPLYWLFLSALVCNCLYPRVLLRSQSARVQRDAAAACDAVLDMTYVITYLFSTHFWTAFSKTFPLTPIAYFATLHPLLHVFGVARALETIAARRQRDRAAASKAAARQQEDLPVPIPLRRGRSNTTGAAATRLSLPRAVAFVTISLGAVGLNLRSTFRDGLWLSRGGWHEKCRPCECEDGVLTSCDIPTALGLPPPPQP